MTYAKNDGKKEWKARFPRNSFSMHHRSESVCYLLQSKLPWKETIKIYTQQTNLYWNCTSWLIQNCIWKVNEALMCKIFDHVLPTIICYPFSNNHYCNYYICRSYDSVHSQRYEFQVLVLKNYIFHIILDICMFTENLQFIHCWFTTVNSGRRDAPVIKMGWATLRKFSSWLCCRENSLHN